MVIPYRRTDTVTVNFDLQVDVPSVPLPSGRWGAGRVEGGEGEVAEGLGSRTGSRLRVGPGL